MSASGCHHYRKRKETESFLGWLEPAFSRRNGCLPAWDCAGGRVAELLEDLPFVPKREGFGCIPILAKETDSVTWAS